MERNDGDDVALQKIPPVAVGYPIARHVRLLAANILPPVLVHFAAQRGVVSTRLGAALVLRRCDLSQQQEDHGNPRVSERGRAQECSKYACVASSEVASRDEQGRSRAHARCTRVYCACTHAPCRARTAARRACPCRGAANRPTKSQTSP
eukprot:4476610-Prymnesium_polylepis.2